MHSPRQEYFQRASTRGLPRFTHLHHHIMDRVLQEFEEHFSFDDVLQLILLDPVVLEDELVRDKLPLVKVIVSGALTMLARVDMLKEVSNKGLNYQRIWSAD